MSDHSGFEADLSLLKHIADVDLPEVASTISTAGSPVSSLTNYASSVFGSAHGGEAMGLKYNAVLTELSTALTTFSSSVAAATGRLHGIAANYQTIDDSLAGK